MDLEVTVLQGSMRGFAVTAETERQYPERFETLSEAIQNALARKDVQEHLEAGDIGGVWVGPERSNEMMRTNYDVFEAYIDLLNLSLRLIRSCWSRRASQVFFHGILQ